MEKEQHIYLLRPVAHVIKNENIFKVGKTTQTNPKQRFRGYDSGYEVWLTVKCNNCDDLEKKILVIFNEKFKLDHGKEFFNGDPIEMIKTIMDLRFTESPKIEEKTIVNIIKDFNAPINIELRKQCEIGNIEEVKKLIERGAGDFNGGLIMGCKCGNMNIVKIMIDNGAGKKENEYKEYMKPLNDLKRLQKILINGGIEGLRGNHQRDIKLKTDNDLIPFRDIYNEILYKSEKIRVTMWDIAFYNACDSGNIELVKLTINNGANEWEIGLRIACTNRNIELVDLMLSYDRTLSLDGQFMYTCTVNNFKFAKLLLERGVKRHLNEGLEFAIKAKDFNFAKLIIDKGREREKVRWRMDYNLAHACNRNDYTTMKFLLDNGTDPYLHNYYTGYATYDNYMLGKMVEHHCDLYCGLGFAYGVEAMKLLMEYGVQNYDAGLFRACIIGDIDLIDKVIALGREYNWRSCNLNLLYKKILLEGNVKDIIINYIENLDEFKQYKIKIKGFCH